MHETHARAGAACVAPVDLADARQARALIDLLDHYARDPMGGGHPLAPDARERLVGALARIPGFQAAIAWAGAEPVGLVDTFVGFSTFAARPLLNIHDIVVRADWRGRGVGAALLRWAEARARALGCCKLTLEVLSENRPARRAYERAGFAPYMLDPAAGQALLLQKLLAD